MHGPSTGTDARPEFSIPPARRLRRVTTEELKAVSEILAVYQRGMSEEALAVSCW